MTAEMTMSGFLFRPEAITQLRGHARQHEVYIATFSAKAFITGHAALKR
jgi:hypothetical protein